MPLAVDDGANSSGVTTTGDHAKIAGLELDEVHNLVSVNVQTERVVDLIEKRTSFKDLFAISGHSDFARNE